MGIFSEAIADAILGNSVEVRIEQYLKGLGGDGGLRDGEIHGIRYDVKSTSGSSETFTLKGGIGNKDRKAIFIFSKLALDEESLQATIVFYGYAWRSDVIPYSLPKAKYGAQIALQNLPVGTVEPNLERLRDWTDPKFNLKPCWTKSFQLNERNWPGWCEPEET